MIRASHLLLLFAFVHQAAAQDGKLVDRTPFTIPDSSIAHWRAAIPRVDALLAGVRLARITYLSDGLKVKGYMAVPVGKGPFPCVIFCRGGNRDFGRIGDGTLVRYLATIASWGYVVVGSQYRGNDGGEGKEEFGGADVDDVLNLMPLLARLPEADTTRIGLFGGSRGGMMAYLTLTRTTRIKAAVMRSGMTDAILSAADRPEMDTVFAELIPGYAANRDSALLTRSPARWADRLCKTTPILLEAGTGDWRVKPDQAFAMAQALYACQHPFRLLMFEGADHALAEFREDADQASRSFLDRYVRDGKPWPSLVPHGD